MEQITPQPGARANRLSAWLPSRGSTVLVVLVTLIMVWASKTGALAPTSPQAPAANSTAIIPYQGRLSHQDGHSVNRTLPMIFRLWTAQTGGSLLWTETWPAVEITNGLFNVQLGSITNFPAELFSTNPDLWLEIKVGSDAEMTPRVQLGAAPFAITVPNGSITTTRLAPLTVTEAKLADNSVSPAKLKLPSVHTSVEDTTTQIGTQLSGIGSTTLTIQTGGKVFAACDLTVAETTSTVRWVSVNVVATNGANTRRLDKPMYEGVDTDRRASLSNSGLLNLDVPGTWTIQCFANRDAQASVNPTVLTYSITAFQID